MSRRKNFRQSNWLIELSPRKNVEPRIVGIRSLLLVFKKDVIQFENKMTDSQIPLV